MKTPTARKLQSIAILKERDVPFIDHLPCIESAEETTLRDASDVAKRIAGIVLAADFAWGNGDSTHFEMIEEHGMQSWFTEREWVFINDPETEEKAKARFSWRIEGAYLLLWALGKISDMPWPRVTCDVGKVYQCLSTLGADPEGFIKSSSLIDKETILDQSDLIYRLHWAVADANLIGQPAPVGLNSGVISEWHHAINWLTCYGGCAEWEDVTTDT